MTTVLVLNPMGADVLPFVNRTPGVPQLLKGTICAPGDPVIRIPYNNAAGRANVEGGVPLLDNQIHAVIDNSADDVLVFAYSEGCQVAVLWLWLHGGDGIDPARLKFLLIGNAERNHGGFMYGHSEFDIIGHTAGYPPAVPYQVMDFARQYDAFADFPASQQFQNVLEQVGVAANDNAYILTALQQVATLSANTDIWTAAQNAVSGASLVHQNYLLVTLADAGNVRYVDPRWPTVTFVWSPTYPVPMLGLGTIAPQADLQLRTVIERFYDRPVDIPMPDYSGISGGWVTGPKPVTPPPTPVTGWWAAEFLTIAPEQRVLGLAGGRPQIRVGQGAAPNPGVLSLAGGAPVIAVSQHRVVAPDPGELSLIGSRPAIGATFRPDGGELGLAGGAPVIALSDNLAATPSGGALALAGGRPAVAVSDHQVATPGTGALALAGGQLAIVTPQTFAPGGGQLGLAGAAPVVTSSNIVTPSPGALALTGGQPVVALPVLVVPGGGALGLVGSRPALGTTLRPPGGALGLVGGQPVAALSDNKMLTPLGQQLGLAGGQPAVAVSDHKVATPSGRPLSLAGGVPVVNTPQLVVPAGRSLSLAGGQPAITIVNPFTPFSEENIARTNQAVPAGATQWRWRAFGGGAGGGAGNGGAGSDRRGGGGGGGAAYQDTGWQPISALGSTYSNARGLKGAASTDGGDSTFISGSVSLAATGGAKGATATTAAPGGGGAGGVATATGITAATLANGTAGAQGGQNSTAAPGAVNNTTGGAPGGGGGATRNSFAGTYASGKGGDSIAASGGAARAAGSTSIGAGGETPTGTAQPGGGGGGGPTNSSVGRAGGVGGSWGAGGGGGGGGDTAGAGGSGADGYTLLEFA